MTRDGGGADTTSGLTLSSAVTPSGSKENSAACDVATGDSLCWPHGEKLMRLLVVVAVVPFSSYVVVVVVRTSVVPTGRNGVVGSGVPNSLDAVIFSGVGSAAIGCAPTPAFFAN